MSNSKPRLVKDYDKLTEAIRDQIKLAFPEGYIHHLISFTDKEGANVSALPFETEDTYYLVRMTKQEAATLIEEDEDFGDDGFLKDEIKLDLEDKQVDFEDLSEEDEPADTKEE